MKEPLKLDPASIQMLYEIGQGEYGSVLKGIWTCTSGEKVRLRDIIIALRGINAKELL